MIDLVAGQYYVTDLASTNGCAARRHPPSLALLLSLLPSTFLDGEELVAGTPAPLLAGSELVIGAPRFLPHQACACSDNHRGILSGDEFLCKFKLEFLP
jgi:hypothetical protein